MTIIRKGRKHATKKQTTSSRLKKRNSRHSKRVAKNKQIGSSLDDLLKEEGIFEETQAQAIKEEVVAWPLAKTREKRKLSKAAMLKTSRTDSRDEWKPLKTAPKDGTELIFWVSSQKGFQDITANFYFRDGAWWWSSTEDRLKRPDLVKGWMIYPQPPTLS